MSRSRCLPTDLSTTQRQLTLSGWDGSGDGPTPQQLLTASAVEPCWRIIEAVSRQAAPFELRLSWGAGGLSVGGAKMTVPRATRVAVFAKTLDLFVANLHTADNTIAVAISDSDSFVQTRNQWEERGQAVDDVYQTLDIPPFATHARLDVNDHASLPDFRLSLIDGQGTLRLNLTADQLPQDGVPLGGAHQLQVVHTTSGTVDWRVVFLLSL